MKDMEVDLDKTPKGTKITPSVLDAFDLLKSSKEDTKLVGGIKIISQLQHNETEKDMQYTIKRLVRSLGANVPEMRSGYFATLVTLFKYFDKVNVSQLLELVKKELHANGSSKKEVGDVALGQILVCSALFRSGLILKCPTEQQIEVIQLLRTASTKKSYLSTVAYLVLLDFVNLLNEEQFSSIVWSNIKQDFKKDIKDHSLDSLYFLIMISSKYPDKVKPRKLIGAPEILCEDTIHIICEKLMTGIDFNSLSHPIFREIARRVANSPYLLLFWTSGIDSQLSKHNRNRELVAVNMLTTILNNLQDNFDVIPELISRNFFKLFMDWFKGLQTASKIRNKNDNEDDHKIMIKKEKELLNALAKALKSDKVESNTRMETLKKLLFNPGEINFTEITGTSIVKSIILDLDKDHVKILAKLFKGVLLNTSKKFIKEDNQRNWYNNERVKGAELLTYLVNHETVKDDIEFKLIYMKLLMCFGFFKIGVDESSVISSELSGAIKSSFYRCFTSRFSNVDNLVEVLSSLCNFINTILEKEDVRNKLEKQFPKENMECWETLTDVCQKIVSNKAESKVDKVFLILLYQLGLFLFSEPTHVKMAKSSIKELKSCYEHYKKGKKRKPNKNKVSDSAENEPEWIEVLVEVLLYILSCESSILRSVVQCVFRLLWEYLTPSSIEQIVSVLDPNSESNPLMQDSESEDDGSDEEDEDDENENGTGEENDIEKNDDESDSDVEEDDDEDMKIPDQLRLAVQKALGSAAPDTDTESIDVDMIDEDEGRKLDETLAEAFRQYQQGKGKKTKKERKDKKALSDFRIRVLDLIDIYLEKDPSMDICLEMIAPLTRCLEFCMQDNQFSELENRIRKTIKTLTKIKKFSTTDNITIDILCDYLKSTIDKGSRSHFMFQALGDVVTHFATFIIHCSQKIDVKHSKLSKKSKSTSPLIDIFKEALQSYFQNRNCLLPIIFFHTILQIEWKGSYELVPILISNMFDDSVRQFRRNEALDLMTGFYRALKRCKPTSDELLKKLSNLEITFENTLNDHFKGDKQLEVKNVFILTLKKLINIMKMFHESCHVDTNLDFKSLIDKVGQCKVIVKPSNQNNIQKPQSQAKKAKSKKNKKKRKSEKLNGQIEPQEKRMRTDSGQSE